MLTAAGCSATSCPPMMSGTATMSRIKWGVHPPGDRRAQWVTGEQRTAVLMLISGRFRVELPGQDVLLARQGDYVVFHGIGHSWEAEEESVVLSVRWPSIPGYAVPEQAQQ